MSAHTEGPWYVTGADIHSGAPGTDRWIATVSAGQGDTPHAADYANARLIAAAPELLAALKDAARILDGRNSPLAARVRAAIAKAEGRETRVGV